MSKNFELLQRIGKVEALFDTAIQAEDAVPEAKDESSLALDKDTFERIMLNASLPDVFETVNEPPPLEAFRTWSEPRPDVPERNKASVSQDFDFATVFRPSENPASWIDNFEDYVERSSTQNTLESPSSSETPASETAVEEHKLPLPTSSRGMESTAPVKEPVRRN